MATEATEKGIVNRWSLLSFAKKFGPTMKVGECKNSKTEEKFASCIFENEEGERTFVNFSSNLGELTPEQIAQRKDELQVVKLSSGTYKLCKQGEDSWQEVKLF